MNLANSLWKITFDTTNQNLRYFENPLENHSSHSLKLYFEKFIEFAT